MRKRLAGALELESGMNDAPVVLAVVLLSAGEPITWVTPLLVVYELIAGALIFNYVVTIENIPNSLAKFMGGFQLGKMGFLLLVNIVLLILGCLLEGSTILLVIVPIFIPTAKALGIDLVHFGVVVVVNIMIGLVTPPYGLLLFVLASMTKQPLGAIAPGAVIDSDVAHPVEIGRRLFNDGIEQFFVRAKTGTDLFFGSLARRSVSA